MIINYNYWNVIRYELLKATIYYLEKVLLVYCIKNKNKIIIYEILQMKNRMLISNNDFLYIINSNKNFINYFIHLKIYGIYILLESVVANNILYDHDHIYYSYSNLLDILELIKKVKYFIKDYNILDSLELIILKFQDNLLSKNNYCITFDLQLRY